jgi:glycine cleavage system H protein
MPDEVKYNPHDLLYATTHEWVHVAQQGGEKVATVGISAFAVQALTDLVYIELPPVGRMLKAGEPFGEIESVKAVSDLYSPVDGEVIAANESLRDHLERLSEDPYGAGWLVKLRLTDDAGLKQLLNYAAYERQCAEEQH